MIIPMKKITVYALKNSRKLILETLQKTGCVEIDNIEKSNYLTKPNVSEHKTSFERYMTSAGHAISILNEIQPEKEPMFSEKESVSIDYYSLPKDEVEETNKAVYEIISKKKQLEDNVVSIAQLNSGTELFGIWKNLDIPMNYNSLKNAETALYTLNGEISTELMDSILDEKFGVYYEIISSAKDVSCVWLVFLRRNSKEVHSVLRENGFVPPSVSLSHRTPSDKLTHIKAKISSLEHENKVIRQELLNLCQKRRQIKLLYDYMKVRYEKYDNLERLAETSKTFILNGYIPEKYTDEIKQMIEDKACAYVCISDVGEDEEAPVQFENKTFARAVEGITRTYSMPSKTDIDPNGIMAFFYYLFFGMMFSDAGYGLMVMLVTGWLAFVKKYNKDTMTMFFFCGVSTTFWGLMYGSFFGDLIYRFSYTFLGKEIAFSPIWIDPVKEPLLLLIFSVVLGVIQIIVGLCINFYIAWRNKRRTDAISDTGSWILILVGVIFIAGGMVFGIDLITKIGIVLSGVGVLIVLLMKGRDTKNPFVRLFKGVLGLYDVTSYVSDALSYSRLMALGLATGVIAQVVNIMGTISGKSVLGFIMFIVVFVIGHLLNFAINMLGAYVHTNRLQYVEFYSKFYEGGGREFKPLKMDTEYFKYNKK